MRTPLWTIAQETAIWLRKGDTHIMYSETEITCKKLATHSFFQNRTFCVVEGVLQIHAVYLCLSISNEQEWMGVGFS